MSSKSDEKELRRILAEIRILESVLEDLRNRFNITESALAELKIAGSTLENLERKGTNTEILVPIGAGSYIKAKLESTDVVIVGVGSGVAIEKSWEEAKEAVGNRIAQIEKIRNELQRRIVAVMQRINEERNKAQELAAKLKIGAEGVKSA